MKKILVMMLVVVLCMAMLSGCGSNTGDTDIIGSSDVVEENTESITEDASMSAETDMADREVVNASEEESENVEETVMYSADEVMAHIDTLISQYTYNDPEHIKALVIAANLDYISEKDLDIILTTYGYSMEELFVLYDDMSNGKVLQEQRKVFDERIQNCSDEMTYVERTTFSYTYLNDYRDGGSKKMASPLINACWHVYIFAAIAYHLQAYQYCKPTAPALRPKFRLQLH